MSEVVYVSGDDWFGIYINGELLAEGHSPYPRDWLTALERVGARTAEVYADQDWLERVGRLPAKLGHVVKDSE